VPQPFEIITVPDFSGRGRASFEARTILFLASWMDNAGEAKRFPLHIACIGEPPDTVRLLADRAGAILSIHEPLTLSYGHSANKLRGLEVEPRTDRFLLVDTDIIFLGDPGRLADFHECIAAAPASVARVPINLWTRFYEQMGLALPNERIALIHSEVDMPPIRRSRFQDEFKDTARSLPYYNGGVVFASWKHGLRQLWETCLEQGASIVDASEAGAPGLLKSDQGALALAIAVLRSRGVEFRRLPDVLHARWRHLYQGPPSPEEILILHATGLEASGGQSPGHGAPIDRWLARTRSRLLNVLLADVRRGRPVTGLRRYRGARKNTAQIQGRLRDIYRNQIAGSRFA